MAEKKKKTAVGETAATKQATAFPWKEAAQQGLITGILLVLVSVIGMVETFFPRSIISGVINMGQFLLFVIILALSFLSAQRLSGNKPLVSVLIGGLNGAVGAAMLAAFVWLSQTINLRDILVNVSPTLIRILTFDQELPGSLFAALLILVVSGASIGAGAGFLQSLDTKYKKPIITGILWVAVLGLLGELIRTILTGHDLIDNINWMLGSRIDKGLSQMGALAIFAVVAAATFLSQMYGPQVRARVSARRQALAPKAQRGLNAILMFIAFALLWQLPAALGLYLSDVANNVGLFILMGLGLNIVVGFAGLLDLGYVAFFAIGAYVTGVATSSAVGTNSGEILFSLGWSFWAALPLAIAVAVFAGIILGIPVLKMRGDYLAIVTLGFGEIIRILAISDWLKPYIGGAQGIVGIAPIIVAGQNLSRPTELFHVILIGCTVVGFIAWRLRDSRIGRSWKAVREDEDVAEAMGINLVRTKLMAFATGAGFSGLAGAIFASKLSSLNPGSFTLLVSINILSLIIIGGMGSIPGVVVGAMALVALPELLREFAEYRLLVYGAVLVMMMLYKPEGLWPEETNKLELHIDENMPPEPTA